MKKLIYILVIFFGYSYISVAQERQVSIPDLIHFYNVPPLSSQILLMDLTFMGDTIAVKVSMKPIFEDHFENSFSYAIDQSISSAHIGHGGVFKPQNQIFPASVKKVLAKAFQKADSFSIKNHRKLKKGFPKNSILIFYNQPDNMTNAVFYSGEAFLLKESGAKATTHEKLNPIIEQYWATKYIAVYKLDYERMKAYAETHPSEK